MTTPKLLKSLRQDPQKVDEGVWIEHPQSGDKFRRRPVMCSQHAKAYLAAVQDFYDEHGEGTEPTEEQSIKIDAIAASVGLVTDWKLVDDPEMEYDPSLMAVLLSDPELREFQTWFRMQCQETDGFRPEEAGKD